MVLLLVPISGTLILNEDSTFSFAPAVDFSGEVQFTYEVTDGENTASANVIIVINPAIQPQETVVLSTLATAGGNSFARKIFEAGAKRYTC